MPIFFVSVKKCCRKYPSLLIMCIEFDLTLQTKILDSASVHKPLGQSPDPDGCPV